MTVKLMLTCLCDALYGEVGIATVRVLEHAGCSVEFPKGQTCCGQPPFNAGDWDASRIVARRCRDLFFGKDQGDASSSTPVVTPSSSCAAMIREGYPLMFGYDDHLPVYELSEFLVDRLGIDRWPIGPAPEPVRTTKVAYHRACHGRSIGLKEQQIQLLASVPGIQVVTLDQPEQCCGFGGAFCVNHPTVSAGIGDEKLKRVVATGANTLVGGDMGCLVHLQGLIEKEGLKVEVRHFAEILADAIPAKLAAGREA
ncbi:MAG TPA: (Fe-S)-binding protein [Fimbriimonadaceae bacterium]|nr:(Fe-S)-binding protein [Fimbriimonadaceae bacterium]